MKITLFVLFSPLFPYFCLGVLRCRYNRCFQELLTYRRIALELQRLQLRPLKASRDRWAFKAQLSFFWSQVPWFCFDVCVLFCCFQMFCFLLVPWFCFDFFFKCFVFWWVPWFCLLVCLFCYFMFLFRLFGGC